MNAVALAVEEYLKTNYEPDREYVDGCLVERNVGTQLHSFLQAIITGYLLQLEKGYRFKVATEARLAISSNPPKYRIPDVIAVMIPYERGRIVTDVPLLTVEIKSPDDSFDDILEKCFEYEALGVRNIFVIDPDNERSYLFKNSGLLKVDGLVIDLPSGEKIPFPIADMFVRMKED